MFSSKLTTLILIAFCTIMGNLIYYFFNHSDQTIEFDSNHQTTNIKLEEAAVSQAHSLNEPSHYEEITLRPLFSNTRQTESELETEEQKEAAPAKPPARNPNFNLIGIVIHGKEKMALIKGRRDPKPKQVKMNEQINGWTLVEVNANSAKLKSRSQTITLEMTRKGDPKQAQKRLNALAQTKQQLQINNRVKYNAPNHTRPPNQNSNQAGSANQADFDIRDINGQTDLHDELDD